MWSKEKDVPISGDNLLQFFIWMQTENSDIEIFHEDSTIDNIDACCRFQIRAAFYKNKKSPI